MRPGSLLPLGCDPRESLHPSRHFPLRLQSSQRAICSGSSAATSNLVWSSHTVVVRGNTQCSQFFPYPFRDSEFSPTIFLGVFVIQSRTQRRTMHAAATGRPSARTQIGKRSVDSCTFVCLSHWCALSIHGNSDLFFSSSRVPCQSQIM